MSYGEKEKFSAPGLTSGLTAINRKKMTLSSQGRSVRVKIVNVRELVRENEGDCLAGQEEDT